MPCVISRCEPRESSSEVAGDTRFTSPSFVETDREDAISYRDWHSEIEDALKKGYDPTNFKSAMFATLEGMVKDNTKMIDEHINLSPTCILDGLDSLYGTSMTFQLRHTTLCGTGSRNKTSHCRTITSG